MARLLLVVSRVVSLVLALPFAAAAQVRATDSLDLYASQVQAAREAVDSSAFAAASRSLGLVYWRADRYDSALVHLVRARELYAALGDQEQLGRTLNSLGASYYQSGIYAPALEAFLQSLAIRRDIGDVRGEAVNLTNIGKTYQDWRQTARADSVLRSAVEAARRSGDDAVLGYALHSLGGVLLDQTKHDEAESIFLESIESYRRFGVPADLADVGEGWAINMVGLARLDIARGQPAAALSKLQQVSSRLPARQSVRLEVEALLVRADAHRALRASAEAQRALLAALDRSTEIGQPTLALQALKALSAVEEGRGNLAAALQHRRQYDALRDSIFDQQTALRVAGLELEQEASRQRAVNAELMDETKAQESLIARQRVVVALSTLLLAVLAVSAGGLWWLRGREQARANQLASANAALGVANEELRVALAEVRTLSGFIPICAHCKRVRDDDGYWKAVETYISQRSEAMFSHAICSHCGPDLYGADWEPSAPSTSLADND